MIAKTSEEYGISVDLGSQFDELEKNSGMEIISYQPFVLWGSYSDIQRVSYYMGLYKPENWRLNSKHRDLNVHRLSPTGKVSITTDYRKRTDFLINPKRNEASFYAVACDPPGPRNSYEGEFWYELKRIYDHTEFRDESTPVVDFARLYETILLKGRSND